MSKNLLITGASGFVGHHLIEEAVKQALYCLCFGIGRPVRSITSNRFRSSSHH